MGTFSLDYFIPVLNALNLTVSHKFSGRQKLLSVDRIEFNMWLDLFILNILIQFSREHFVVRACQTAVWRV